jgi:choline dehydrogenase-like flavoprotein
VKTAIVVGSGAGGAVAARELQGAFDVTVLEAGPEFRPFRYDLAGLERLRASRLFLDERMISLLFPTMRIVKSADHMVLVRGACTGGTTTLNTGNMLRCDEALRELGIDLDPEFAALQAELPISTAHERRWRMTTRQLFSACEGLGLDPRATPKAVDHNRCRRCGRCMFGCPTGAKWDSRRMLAQAVAGGARLKTGARVERVVIERGDGGIGASPGSVTGVVVKGPRGREQVPADLVVLAAGGLGTPAILEASGIRSENRLFVDPVLCVAAPWPDAKLDTEIPMPFFVDGGKYIISPYFDHLSFFFNRSWRGPGRHTLSLMIKLADAEVGAVAGRRVRKGLTKQDRHHLAEAVEVCVEIFARLGVRRESVFLGTVNGGHPGGTLPLTVDDADDLHAARLPDGLHVADASLLPVSLGKPPSLTIMALAHRVASVCRERHA